MTVQRFLQELKSPKHRFQLAKSHLFVVEFYLQGGITTDLQMLSLLCHSVTTPGQHLITQPAIIQGLKYEVPVGVQQDDLMCSFYVDRNFQIPQIFDAHRSKIVDQYLPGTPSERGPYTFGYKSDYQIPLITVTTLDVTNRDSDKRAVMRYNNCFVKSMQAMNFDYANTNIQLLSLIIDFEWVSSSYPSLNLTPANPGPVTEMNRILNKTTIPVNFDTLNSLGANLSSFYNEGKNYVAKAATTVSDTIKNFFN
jgi:hypothetical protein